MRKYQRLKSPRWQPFQGLFSSPCFPYLCPHFLITEGILEYESEVQGVFST
jgi:hypothetical protein